MESYFVYVVFSVTLESLPMSPLDFLPLSPSCRNISQGILSLTIDNHSCRAIKKYLSPLDKVSPKSWQKSVQSIQPPLAKMGKHYHISIRKKKKKK